MTVIKRNKENSAQDLIKELEKFIPLLQGQKEDEAVADLRKVVAELKTSTPGDEKHKAAIKTVIEAFEGDHELNAYTHQRQGAGTKSWTDADELSIVSARVFNLARRFNS